MRTYFTAIGEDSHRFTEEAKVLKLAGVEFPAYRGFLANSDGDIVLHALCHALASLGGLDPFLGPRADELARAGEVDSTVYLKRQLADLKEAVPSIALEHVSISLEGKTPKIYPMLQPMRKNLASLLNLKASQIGITAHTGEGLSALGQGEGMACRVLISASRNSED